MAGWVGLITGKNENNWILYFMIVVCWKPENWKAPFMWEKVTCRGRKTRKQSVYVKIKETNRKN
jgi:hypothetical protein